MSSKTEESPFARLGYITFMPRYLPFVWCALSFFPPQINYLDESDVNGFQIYVNDSPTFLCTAMTHTPTLTTKANTCYTGGFKNFFSFYIYKSHVFFVLGGVTFLEHGDRVHVKNLDENRYFVSCSLAHLPRDVYGLSPLQQMGMMSFDLFTLGLNFAPAPC